MPHLIIIDRFGNPVEVPHGDGNRESQPEHSHETVTIVIDAPEELKEMVLKACHKYSKKE